MPSCSPLSPRFHPPKIAEMLGLHQNYVRTIIKAFQKEGLEALKPKYCGVRPRKFTDEQREALASLATSKPSDLDLPFQEWSLSRLKREAIRRKIVDDISVEWKRTR
jgi:transposase